MRIPKLAGVGAAVALFVAGVAGAAAFQDKMIQITDKGYTPDRIELVVGQKVVFQNTTQKDHTVTSKSPADSTQQDKDKTAFDSGTIKPGTSWEHSFSKEGTFSFFCKEDKSMMGTIVVNPAK